MVREALDEELFEVELEKAVAKQKFETMFNESKDDCPDSSSRETPNDLGKRTSFSESKGKEHGLNSNLKLNLSEKVSPLKGKNSIDHKREVL